MERWAHGLELGPPAHAWHEASLLDAYLPTTSPALKESGEGGRRTRASLLSRRG